MLSLDTTSSFCWGGFILRCCNQSSSIIWRCLMSISKIPHIVAAKTGLRGHAGFTFMPTDFRLQIWRRKWTGQRADQINDLLIFAFIFEGENASGRPRAIIVVLLHRGSDDIHLAIQHSSLTLDSFECYNSLCWRGPLIRRFFFSTTATIFKRIVSNITLTLCNCRLAKYINQKDHSRRRSVR